MSAMSSLEIMFKRTGTMNEAPTPTIMSFHHANGDSSFGSIKK